MRRATFLAGAATLLAAWAIAAAGAGMTGHMTAHMLTVAVAAPLLAAGIEGTSLDPVSMVPSVVSPLPMSLVELLVVWGWHLPAARAFAASSVTGLALEQAMFLVSGLLLWSACLGSRSVGGAGRRAAGVIALLLTTMHMTLLGALITLAPRPLYAGVAHLGMGHPVMADQQTGGVVMLLVGAGSYLAGGLLLLARILRDTPAEHAA